MMKRLLVTVAASFALLAAGCQTAQCDTAKMIQEKDAAISAAQEDARMAERELAACQAEGQNKDRTIAKLETQVDNLTSELAKCKGSRVEMSMEADVLFEPGSARLSAGGKEVLDEAAEKIMDGHHGEFITVEGHTDSDPIRHSNWKDNWDLGSARALAVLRYMHEKGVDPAKTAACTFSKYQAVSDQKAQNRRAIIVIHSGWPMY